MASSFVEEDNRNATNSINEEDRSDKNKEAISSIIVRLYGNESGPISIKKAL